MWTTRKSLIDRVLSGDEESWETFYANYSRLVYAIGEKGGLTFDECNDLVQDVMRTIFAKRDSFRYDARIGKFRTYLTGIVKHKVYDAIRARMTGSSLDEEGNVEPEVPTSLLEEACQSEWKNHVLNTALIELSQIVDPVTFDAFQMYVLQELDPKVVARTLSISESSVYVYKNRCVKHLRATIERYRSLDPEFRF